MPKKPKTPTTEPPATTGTETDAPTAPQQGKQQGKQQYLPAAELWRRAVDQIVKSQTLSPAQAESWLRPCQLATMDLPSGAVVAAAVRTPTSYSAEHVRHCFAAVIRVTLQRLTNKHVVLFVRGPGHSPDDSPWVGPPDGYPFNAA